MAVGVFRIQREGTDIVKMERHAIHREKRLYVSGRHETTALDP